MHTSINELWLNDQQYRYAFYKSSSENAPYGIFLMGNLQEIESVDFFSSYFSQHLNLFVVEIPGTGLTSPLPAIFSIQEQAVMLVDFIKTINISAAHILAFSYATPVALEFCNKWDGAESLSMCGGMAGIPPESRLSTMSIISDAIHDRKKFAEEFIKGLTVKDNAIKRGKIIARSARQKVFKYTEKQIMCFCENTLRILAYKPSNDINNIKIPCLLFTGKKDPYVTEKNAKHLASLLSNCQFHMIDNADHLVHLEYPNETAALMIQLSKEHINRTELKKAPKTAA